MNKFNIIDIEATCWRTDIPPGQEEELIEIGIVSIDRDEKNLLNAGSFLIKPEKSEISKYCTNLTGITQEMIDEEAMKFQHVLRGLQSLFEIHKRQWGSWGMFDYDFLIEECDKKNVLSCISKDHVNIKKLDKEDENLQEEKSLQTSINRRVIDQSLPQHRAMGDAISAANIYLEIIGN